jgi:hypothetical protein
MRTMSLALICTLLPGAVLAQQVLPVRTSTAFSGSPSLSNASGTKLQQVYTGTALFSTIKSAEYCDARTRQIGVFGTVSDSVTKSAATSPAVAVIADEAGANFLHGLPGENYVDKDAKNHPSVPHIDHQLTQNFVSLSSDFYINNSIGIALQQFYTVGYQRYLTACATTDEAKHLFSSVGIGAGFADQRLYNTTARVNSAIVPLTAQASYVFLAKDSSKSPHAIVSLQVGYTPFLNDLHAYQVFENSTVLFPTALQFMTVQFQQTDYYVNNAPRPDKRNYHTEALQLTFTFSYNNPKITTIEPAKYDKGACYTADKSSHLFCYNAASQNACLPPSIFRPDAVCSSVGHSLELAAH